MAGRFRKVVENYDYTYMVMFFQGLQITLIAYKNFEQILKKLLNG